MQANISCTQQSSFLNRIIHGDCIQVMRRMPEQSVDFILTDPPYLVNFRDRTGRTLQNDSNDQWLKPAFAEAYRVLRENRFMVSFYGWSRVAKFVEAWHEAGFRLIGHMVFWKSYTSKARFLKYQHEQAYLLAKGNPSMPQSPLPDVLRMHYTGNGLHPTQKSVTALVPVIRAFSKPGDLVLDCFCGSGSTCAAALLSGRRFLGIEADENYYPAAAARMERIHERIAQKRSSTLPSHLRPIMAASPRASRRTMIHPPPVLTRAIPATPSLAMVGMALSARSGAHPASMHRATLANPHFPQLPSSATPTTKINLLNFPKLSERVRIYAVCKQALGKEIAI